MREEILSNLQNPSQLERLYRGNKAGFRAAFTNLYPELNGNLLAECWHERLHYEPEEISWGSRRELLVVVVIALLAGFIAKLPAIFLLDEDFFYPRNMGFIIIPALVAYFAWKQKMPLYPLSLLLTVISICLLYINLLPANQNSDTLQLACIHLPLLLWFVLGAAFTGTSWRSHDSRLAYLRYNGELIVMTTLILISGAILTGITIGLFSLIGLAIGEVYFNYVVVYGLAAAPVVGTYLTQANPQLVSKVSPVIARVFSPLVLVTLVVYLAATLFSAKDPYTDRDFLILFNVLLIGVMAIIFFSAAQGTGKPSGKWVLLLLSVVTVLVNGIALSAILYRVLEWGITPNRLAVMGGNMLMLVHLLLVTAALYTSASGKPTTNVVGRAICRFLPLYALWAALVVFLFPVLFGFQ